MKRILGLVAILMMCAASAFADIEQNAKISYDKDNYLVFEDVGRKTDYDANGQATSWTYGKFVRLHVHRDGKQFDIDLVDPKYSKQDPSYKIVAPRTVSIQYADKDDVWFVNESHTGQWCTLFSLKEKKAVKNYWGLQIEISPDGGKVAIVADDKREDTERNQYLAFVNDVMVFPYVEPGFTRWDLFSINLEHRIVKANGVSAADFLNKKPPVAGHLVPEIEWIDKDSVKFHVKDQVGDTTATCHIVMGLSDLGTSPTQHIRVLKDDVDEMPESAGER